MVSVLVGLPGGAIPAAGPGMIPYRVGTQPPPGAQGYLIAPFGGHTPSWSQPITGLVPLVASAMPWPEIKPAPARLISFVTSVCTARRSCCISAFCDTTQVASTPWLKIFTPAPITSMPSARETINSRKVKPRAFRMCLIASLAVLRNIGVKNVVLCNLALGRRVGHSDSDHVQRGDRLVVGIERRCDGNGARIVRERQNDVVGCAVNSVRARQSQFLQTAGGVIRGSDDAIDARTISGLRSGEENSSAAGVLNLVPGKIVSFARSQNAFQSFIGQLLRNRGLLRGLSGCHRQAEHTQEAYQADRHDHHGDHDFDQAEEIGRASC